MVTPREAMTAAFPEAIEPMDLLKARGLKVRWMKAPDMEAGSPMVNGCDLSKPGCVWTPYTPPKVKARG